jgi:hypothetical protein
MCLQGSDRWRSPATPRTGWRWSAWTSTPSASSRACARSSATLTSSRWRKVKDKKPGGEKQEAAGTTQGRGTACHFFPIKIRRTFPPIRQEKHTKKKVFGSVRLFGKSVTRSRRSTKLSGVSSGCTIYLYYYLSVYCRRPWYPPFTLLAINAVAPLTFHPRGRPTHRHPCSPPSTRRRWCSPGWCGRPAHIPSTGSTQIPLPPISCSPSTFTAVPLPFRAHSHAPLYRWKC